MKLTRHLPLLASMLASHVLAQAPAPSPSATNAAPAEARPAPKLTDQQASTVLAQLESLEKDIAARRGDFLKSVVSKLEDACASDQAALNFYLDAYSLVNIERKGGTKMEARDKEDALARRMEGNGSKKGGEKVEEQQGDQGRAIKLGIRYLILTLEARECVGDDIKKMIPKLQAYMKELIESAPKLKGRAANMIKGGTAPIVEAYKLGDYLGQKKGAWSPDPANIGGMYDQTLLPFADHTNEAAISALWDARIATEDEFARLQLAKEEYDLWHAHELPKLRWQRASYLYSRGPNPVNCLAAMFAIIKELPGHPMAAEWLEEVRTAVKDAQPAPVVPVEKPIGSQ